MITFFNLNYGILTGSHTLGHREFGINTNEEVLHIPQSSKLEFQIV